MIGCGTCSDGYSCDTCYSDAYEEVTFIGLTAYDICKVKCPPNKLRDLTTIAKECTLECLTNCEECTDTTTCDTCEDGYFIDDPPTCTACVANCEICSDGTSCDTCKTGWEEGTDPCDTCKADYFFDGSDCAECTIDDCTTCTDATTCGTCDDGFYVDGAGTCTECVDNCKVCSDGTSCDTCKTGYENDTGICDGCASGFGLKPDGDCVCPIETFLDTAATPEACAACTADCIVCENATSCLFCRVGYTITAGADATTSTCVATP